MPHVAYFVYINFNFLHHFTVFFCCGVPCQDPALHFLELRLTVWSFHLIGCHLGWRSESFASLQRKDLVFYMLHNFLVLYLVVKLLNLFTQAHRWLVLKNFMQ